jgi:hypothetical protein
MLGPLESLVAKHWYLKAITLGNNALQHSKKFAIPFNNTIYEYLARQNFTTLRKLTMANLDLD